MRQFTATVYILFLEKVLLHRHAKLGKWLPPGGHIEQDETPPEAARREVKEETGLDIEKPRVFHAIARVNQLGEHWTTIYFLAHAGSDDVKLSWEHDEYKWIRPEELEAMEGSTRNKDAVAYFIETPSDRVVFTGKAWLLLRPRAESPLGGR